MHPILWESGAWQVTSYGFALTSAFAAGIALGAWRARRAGLAVEPVFGVSIVIIVCAIVGSRVFYALTSPGAVGDGLDAVNPFAGAVGISGLSVMGGLPAALGGAWLYLVARRLPVAATMDLLAPSVALGAGITRVGCFFNGCCHGVACALPWAVRYPEGSIPFRHLGAVGIHPTQLYQSLAGFALAAALLWYARRRPRPGSLVAALLVGWGLQRLWVEALRYQSADELWFRWGGAAVSVYQGAALGLLGVGLVLWLGARKGWTRLG